MEESDFKYPEEYENECCELAGTAIGCAMLGVVVICIILVCALVMKYI